MFPFAEKDSSEQAGRCVLQKNQTQKASLIALRAFLPNKDLKFKSIKYHRLMSQMGA